MLGGIISQIILAFLLIQASYADTTTGLVGWWKFDEPSSNALDYTGYGNTGTLTNNPSRVGDCLLKGCLSFSSASSQYVAITNKSMYQADSFTISLKFKLNADFSSASATTLPLITKYSSDNAPPGGNIAMSLRGTDMGGGPAGAGVMIVKYETGGSFYYLNSTVSSWTANVWYHVVVVYHSDPSGARIYINGANVSNSLSSSGTPVTNAVTADLDIARGRFDSLNLGATTYFDGLIDDVRIYNRALSAQDAYMLYLSDNKVRNASLKNIQFK